LQGRIARSRGFGYNDFTSTGALDSFNMYSTTPTGTVADGVQGTPYTVAQLINFVGSSFAVAIDVNTTSAAGETLQLFEVINTTPIAFSTITSDPRPLGPSLTMATAMGIGY
jgi:hypothetical protein